MGEQPTKMPTTEQGEIAVSMTISVESSSTSSDSKTSSTPFAAILELFKVGSKDFYMEFDEESQAEMLASNKEDMEGKPASYKQRFDTICQIYSIHGEIVYMMMENIKKNIFLIVEDCNADLANPVGMLYDESDYCCCSESSMGGFKPVMTTSRGAKPMMTTMRSTSVTMMTTKKSTMMTTMRTPSMGMMTTKKMSIGSSGNSNCKCSSQVSMTTKGPSMKTTQRAMPSKSFKLRYKTL